MAHSFVEDHMHLCTKCNFNLLLFSFTTTKFWANLYIFNWREVHATDTKRSIKTTTRADAYATDTKRSIKMTTRADAYATYTRRSMNINSYKVKGKKNIYMSNIKRECFQCK
jgi:hypothetical protein